MSENNYGEALERFAKLLNAAQIRGLYESGIRHDGCEKLADVHVRPGRLYDKVDIGMTGAISGRYMVEKSTGRIFAIKQYGVPHRGKCFGTLDTIDAYEWMGYHAKKRG